MEYDNGPLIRYKYVTLIMSWYYIYVLLSEKDHQLYTGYTSNLDNRLRLHQAGKVNSTKRRLPVKLIYSEACLNRDDAVEREKYLKSGMGKRYLKNRMKHYFAQ